MKIKNYKDQNLENILEKIIPEFNPQKVILFGSRAKGSHSENSDYDLFFIIEKSDVSRIKRSQKARRLTWKLGYSIDFFIYTQDEFDSWKNEINSIPHSAATTGLELKFV